MRPGDVSRGRALKAMLQRHARIHRALPGLVPVGAIDSFVEQVVESMRRIEYVKLTHIRTRDPGRRDPRSPLFDPIRAASLAQRAGEVDEACWLVFLSVHFGKHRRSGWQLSRDVYGALGAGRGWDWATTSAAPQHFERWLRANEMRLKPTGAVHFGNHRKYESLGPGPRGTAAVVRTYVGWVQPHGGHVGLFGGALAAAGGDPGWAFDHLYRSMQSVMSFGRMARFDYLTMLGKLELAPIEPAIAYLAGATGPVQGARLMFGGHIPVRLLDDHVAKLGASLGVSMQVMEDSLCNWQKSPLQFRSFRG